jgi:peptidoglycan/xylan/chitin deacetylase (PgdA/CDA1 family)
MNIPILMYHQIDTPPARGTPLRGLVVSPGSFARQMRLLKLLGYKGLSMNDLEPYLLGQRQGKVVGITFDDGYQNNLKYALPVLTKHGFTATCYGVSSMIGGTNSWDRHIGVPEKPLMTLQDWCSWRDAGMDIGSHTRTHADLTIITAEEAQDQILGARIALEQVFGCEVRHFCYPYGRFDGIHEQMVKAAGYATATTTRRGRVQPGDNTYALHRSMVPRSTHLPLFAAKILTDYEDKRS